MTSGENNQTSEPRYFSQNGEDKFLEELFSRAGVSTGYFVEFGAWDGKFLSNCYLFYKSHGWGGCYIEGDASRFEDLKGGFSDSGLDLLNYFVTPDGDGSLNNILSKTRAPQDFDLLSVDIDSDDYRVWEALTNYMPKVVVIEFNPTIPNACEYVQPLGANIGNAPRSLKSLAEKKGYELVSAIGTNLFFVRRDLLELFGEVPKSLDEVRPDPGHLFYGYDGTVRSTGVMHTNPWSGGSLEDAATVHRPSYKKLRKSVSRAIRAPFKRVFAGFRGGK